MNAKNNKIIYWIATGLITLLMLWSAGMYIFNYEMVSEVFIGVGYPTYIIYPLAIAKILGLAAIWFIRSNTLKEWAYAGFFFDFVLAFFAHYMIDDGEHVFSLIAILLLLVSHFFGKKTSILLNKS